jgi:hypothetical protein
VAGYSPDEIRDLAARFGSIPEAEEQALMVPGFGDEIRRVDERIGWLSQSYAHPPQEMREKLDEERRRLVVEAHREGSPSPAQSASTSRRGRRHKSVSILQANLVAAVYFADPAEYDDHDDRGAYAVHKTYSDERDPGPAVLSRPMVGHLLDAIRAGLLPWDAETGQLGISDEFRTSKTSFVIPRVEQAP